MISDGITIGQLANYAGVTIKAVRHYHQRGLLDEPPRDASGYRRYTAQHAIALVKIKTLAEAGVREATVRLERDVWILMQSVSPEQAAAWIADKRDAIHDPEFCALYREYDAAIDWSADDPRLAALAERTRRWMAQRRDRPAQRPDPAFANLLATTTVEMPAAWRRLAARGGATGGRRAR